MYKYNNYYMMNESIGREKQPSTFADDLWRTLVHHSLPSSLDHARNTTRQGGRGRQLIIDHELSAAHHIVQYSTVQYSTYTEVIQSISPICSGSGSGSAAAVAPLLRCFFLRLPRDPPILFARAAFACAAICSS